MSKYDKVPFNLPSILGNELAYIKEAVEGGQLAGDGHFTELCQNWLCQNTGAKAALLTHSCTAALELAAIVIGIGPGDEVIMPSYTFVSTANAVVLRGGTPVFVDIRNDTLNLDETKVETAITPRTKAIFVVHYAGVPAEMNSLRDIAQKHNLIIVEDAAQALGSKYYGESAGAIGELGAISFHETKNIISGEGGVLLFRTEQFLEHAEIVREKGTDRKKFFRGEVDKYTWVDLGSSYLPGELIAAFLYGQLEHASELNSERINNWNRYASALSPYSERNVTLPRIPEHCEHNAHLFYMLMPTPKLKSELIARLEKDHVVAPFHYVPLHSSPAGLRFGKTSGDLTVTDDTSARLIRLPLYPRMGDAVDRVIDRVDFHLNELV